MYTLQADYNYQICPIKIIQPAIAAMHGPHSVYDIGQCMVIYCDAGEVCCWLTNEKQRKTDIHLTDQ